MRRLTWLSDNRLALYAVYTVVAAALYWLVFAYFRSLAPFVALGVVVLALVKDVVVDELLLQGSPALYSVVEHNPFNYVLIAALWFWVDVSGTLFGVFRFGDGLLVALAALDLILDFAQDARVEFGSR